MLIEGFRSCMLLEIIYGETYKYGERYGVFDVILFILPITITKMISNVKKETGKITVKIFKLIRISFVLLIYI